MRKYVLNIDKLYCGSTANALVLNQVDREFPVLIDNPPKDESQLQKWIDRWQSIYDEFEPIGNLNEYVVEFNLELQQKFKDLAHSELYMMDDTHGTRKVKLIPYVWVNHVIGEKIDVSFKSEFPKWIQLNRVSPECGVEEQERERLGELNRQVREYVKSNSNLHIGFEYPDLPNPDGTMELNSIINLTNEYLDGLNDYIREFNWNNMGSLKTSKQVMHALNGWFVPNDGSSMQFASQMNVLFPQKKMSVKSLYATRLKVENDIDDTLERALGITLRGQVSYKDCLQGMAQVGNELYTLSPNVNVSMSFEGMKDAYHANNFTVVNGKNHQIFPHTMTLFQECNESQFGKSSVEEFVNWYRRHNHKTIVTQSEEYGTNVSSLKCLGAKSYELELGTYCPDALVFDTDYELSERGKVDYDKMIRLNSDTFRSIRQGKSDYGRYEKDDSGKSHRYVLNNGKSVGIMFNLYDSFVSGNERVLKIRLPRSKDSNQLTLKFNCHMINDNLIGKCQGRVYVNNRLKFDSDDLSKHENPIELRLQDASITDNEVVISIVINHEIDYNRRNSDHDYRSHLIHSGIVLNDIWVDDGNVQQNNLTFGSYVNEDGITQEEHDARYERFWEVSHIQNDISCQSITETHLNNSISNGLQYPNNYSSGDLYGDVFSTKSYLDSKYDMNLEFDDENKLMRMISRDYIGIGQCSNQLYLVFNPTTTIFELDGKAHQSIDKSEDEMLNYQRVEVVRNINRFESQIKHKSNLFSVVVENTNLGEDRSDSRNEEIEKLKSHMRNSISQFVRDTCRGITPAHTQLFDVQFK